ncbi:hypothetical protein OU415_05205 [Saccharopolyspora sp. WRP15-2]|uniref:Phage tail protein n=1 Tax=Saccharopolyspora oryzae TaxID=2997343 RepID=A0ABT4USZ2_9PSEU|nr:hypothetical protein [Saccharopolyspora oryzae]MDA3624825.1 hypothetical protein [Saccharopolyspora oryzae]
MTMDGSPQWSLDSISFGPDKPDSRGVHWILTQEEGFWAGSATGAELHPHLSRHGAIRTLGWRAERTITLEGRAFAPDVATLRRAANQLTGLLADPHRSVPLTCYSEIGPVTCDVFLDDQILTKPGVTATPSFEWSLQLVAPDPRRYALDWCHACTPLSSAGRHGLRFGDGLDFEAKLSFGAGASSGTLHLANDGTAPTEPLLTLHGPLVRPVLSTSQGRQIAYADTLPAGQYLVIDTGAPTAVLNGRTNARYRLFPADFAAFTVPAGGELSIRLDHDGPREAAGHLEVAWRHAWF